MESQKASFVFILGRGRSGTSLLQTVLNSHPQISIAPEAQFIMFLLRRYHNAVWTADTIKAFSRELWLEERLQNWHLNKDSLQQALLHHKNNTNYADICKEVYFQYGKSKEKEDLQVVGDKNPHYALYIKHLAELYPNAQFIHMTRDPRDTILSFKQVNFDANNTATLAYRWNIYNKAINKYKQILKNRFHLIRFEDLLEKPEETLKDLCVFIGVNYDPEMLNFYKKEQDWDTEFRKNLKNPLDPSKDYKWKTYMKTHDLLIANAITSELAGTLDYEKNPQNNKWVYKFISLPNYLYAHVMTFLEKLVYKLPLKITATIISFYRKLTAPKSK